MNLEYLSHYRIIRKLGSGGMGEVYLAQDLELDRTVALKILPGDVAADSERMRRFVQEAKAASSLDHPNVAHIYEIGDASGFRFIAMQYVEGEPLSVKIQNEPLKTDEIIDIAIQVADALEHAHSKGIVHRDIKPANIMVNSRSQVKVLDFGLVKMAHGVAEDINMADARTQVETKPGIIVGTVKYMSPEQVLGKKLDQRSDIFSLGIVLYQIATARLPFDAETAAQTWHQIISSTPEAIARFNYNIPLQLELIIRKCLEKDPARRYQSAADLLIDLRNFKRDSQSGELMVRSPGVVHSPLRTFLIIAGVLLMVGALAVGGYFLFGRPQTIHSIAVLPFADQSPGPGTEYLSDGITESMINRLSQLPNLKVLARGTVFTYKGKEVDPRAVGRELGVDAVVTGSVFHEKENLIVQVNLVNVSDGTQIWGEQYNRKMSDIFTVQTDISQEVSNGLHLKLSRPQEQQLKKQYTDDVEAYRLYLEGRYYQNRRNKESFYKAIESFQKAIAKDPGYALAYAGLSDTYALLSNWGFLSPREGYPRAKAAAVKALELDDTLAEAHTSLASVMSGYEWNWNGAEKNFKRAIELNPNYSTALHWYSFFLAEQGRHEEALATIKKAQAVDPLSLIINANVGFILYVARKYDEAIGPIQRTLELDPRFYLAYQYLGYVYEQQKLYDKSIAALQKALMIAPESMTLKSELARAYAIAGKTEDSRKILTELQQTSSDIYVSPFDIAMIYIGLGDKDLALQWLEKAYQEHSDQIAYLKMDPRLDPLRSDPRFKDLLRRIRLA